MKNSYNRKGIARKPGMSSEKLINLLTVYILMLVFFMLLGLLCRDDWGVRGFPFGWLIGGHFIIYREFFRSLLCMLFIVVVTDITARLLRRMREPEVKTAENTNPYSSYPRAESGTRDKAVKKYELLTHAKNNRRTSRAQMTDIPNGQLTGCRMFLVIMAITFGIMLITAVLVMV